MEIFAKFPNRGNSAGRIPEIGETPKMGGAGKMQFFQPDFQRGGEIWEKSGKFQNSVGNPENRGSGPENREFGGPKSGKSGIRWDPRARKSARGGPLINIFFGGI